MTQIHDNKFLFKKGRGIKSISFTWDDPEKIISSGQPWGGVNSYDGEITIAAGRHKTKECASWYNNYVNGDSTHMVHTGGGSKVPSELNFAIKGTLIVNEKPFSICLGQGSNSGGNNWHLASEKITTDANNKNGEIGNGIRLTQDGNSTFSLSTSIS